MTTSSLPFVKMSGAGNDFIIIDARPPDFNSFLHTVFGNLSRSMLAKKLCRRSHGLGADGLVFIAESEGADFGWDFYNSDGSTAEMCGNAARCVARYAYLKGIAGPEMKFKTAVGMIKAKVLEKSRVEVMMLQPKLIEKDLPPLIDSGVPHVVLKESKLNDTRKLRESVPQHRMRKGAGSRGANVTFYCVTGAGKIDAITFERGVEDFTLACGTGALAAAFAAKLGSADLSRFEVRMPGGQLEVGFPSDQGIAVLTGPALLVAEGVLYKEAVYEEF
jgi:diaminopimelate epimerase